MYDGSSYSRSPGWKEASKYRDYEKYVHDNIAYVTTSILRFVDHYYIPKRDEVLEFKFVVPGEDPDDGANDQNIDDEGNKPVRLLSTFSFFDSKHNMQMVSLRAMDEVIDIDRKFEGAGIVQHLFVNEEDEGQEDDLDEELPPSFVRLGPILRYFIDYAKLNG